MSDHTRWNRAGRRRIDYVDANAAVFLEQLRTELTTRFADTWTPIQDDADLQTEADAPGAAQARAVARYEAEPGDIGWELARTFARACHVLAGHIDAYANEHYIETATQWESMRRLVAMLDYDPNPPASASTPIAVLARAPGRLAAGALQVGHAPAQGDPVVFESLEAIELSPELDGLRLAGWNRSRALADVRDMTWELPEGEDAAIGDVVVVEQVATGVGLATTIGWLEHGRFAPAGAPREAWPLAECRLSLGCKGARAPHLQGDGLVHIERGHGVKHGDVVAWSDGQSWHMALTAAADGDRLRLSATVLPAPGTPLHVARVIADGEQARLPIDIAALGWLAEDGQPTPRDLDTTVELRPNVAPTRTPLEAAAGWLAREPGTTIDLSPPATDPPPDRHKRLRPGIHAGTIFLVAGADPPRARTVLAPPADWLAFDGASAGWSSGAWFVGELADGALEPLRLREVMTLERGFRARFDRPGASAVARVHGPFKHAVRPRGWDFDGRVVSGGDLVLERNPDPALLGRRVLLRASTGEGAAHVATVVQRVGPVVQILPPLPAALGLRAGELEVHGNVVLFGHGERKPGQILGSGDATRSNQRFVLAVGGVSFVADPGRVHGVRADVELFVGGRRWQQVDSLRDSSPTDEHYVVRMTEAGHLEFEAGDGANGRRFPSGTNNLRVELRVGTGLAGNLPAGSLERLAKPHRLVQRLLQPVPAAGGNDMADVDELRERAPRTVLTLGRAVALEDFALLAGGHASVWQAEVRRLPVTGATERVEVVVVPAGGGELGGLPDVLAGYLLARTLPDVDVEIRGYVERGFSLLVRVAVDEQRHVAADVLHDVRAALERRFSLRTRRLGEALELAEVIAVVESTTGVDHSGVILDGDQELERLVAGFDEVLVLRQLEIVATAETARNTATAVQRRAIEELDVTCIQGVGKGRDDQQAPFESALAGHAPSIRKIHELAALDLGWAAPLAPLASLTVGRLRELGLKARLVCELRVPEALISRLGARSLAELLHRDAAQLAAHHDVALADLLALRDQLRTIQMCLDERAMADVRLAQFSVFPALSQRLPPPAASWRPSRISTLPATVIAGVGLETARRLATPPTNCRTLADVAHIDPDRVAEHTGLRPANLWEVKLKARRVLELELPPGLQGPALQRTARELLALDRAGLRAVTGLPDGELAAFHRLLLELELALDVPPNKPARPSERLTLDMLRAGDDQ